ncbi:MAG: 50S ribosomal protein L11 methyltransferase [Pseudomonadales bacterium]|jgi:predicted nicotinamide N-methyase|nr:50S ribosomal protein L11 methyltransferase [Pseudomonadales bacterium]
MEPCPAAAFLDRTLTALVPDARLEARPLPGVPELRLWLLSEDLPRGPLPHAVAEAVVARPPYWAFCWASGQALARRILDAPETVAGRVVLDFGAGSGVAGIAAARAGAARVIACDEDPVALAACTANATLNDVAVETTAALDAVGPVDVVLVADVLYDPANLPLLDALLARDARILLADSRVRPEALDAWTVVGELRADTIPDLDESPLFRTVRFYEPRDRG